MKYKLTDETKKRGKVTLYRIQALKDFGAVKAGDLGGWVESERNLSQEGICWLYDNAQVGGDAMVSGDALVGGDAMVSGDALVGGDAWVGGNARVGGNAWVGGKAVVGTHEKSQVSEFNFSILPSEVEEVVIAGVRYKKETTWKKI